MLTGNEDKYDELKEGRGEEGCVGREEIYDN